MDSKPLLTNTYLGESGVTYLLEYFDFVDFDELPKDRIKQAYGVCFYGDKMVIGYGGLKKSWGLIGGSIEKGEIYEQTLVREIKKNQIWR